VFREPKESLWIRKSGIKCDVRGKESPGKCQSYKLLSEARGGLQAGNIMMKLLFPKMSSDVNR